MHGTRDKLIGSQWQFETYEEPMPYLVQGWEFKATLGMDDENPIFLSSMATMLYGPCYVYFVTG